VPPTQTPTFTRAELRIRQAQPEDQAALEAIASQIWDGNDYLPRVIGDWLNDPHDGFFVATLRDQVVGVTKITRLAEGEWWLEGLRIDPAFQGQGYARIMHHFAINHVRQHGTGIVRFSTGSTNDAVHRLAGETGFERVAVYAPYGADVRHEPVERLRQLQPEDLSRVQSWLDASPHFVAAQRSIEWNWSFYLLTAERLAERIAAGLVYGWMEGDTLAGLVIANPADRDRWPGTPTLKIAYLDARPGMLAALARETRRLAAALDRVYVRIKALKERDRLVAFEEAGFARESDHDLWLYARDVVLTTHAAVRVDRLPPLEN